MISLTLPDFSTTDSLTPAPGEEPPGSARSIPKRAITPTQAGIRELSERLAAAQRPLRILDSVRWDDEVEESFFASKCRELPRVDRAWYQARPLPFDVQGKLADLADLRNDVHSLLGSHPAGRIMMRWCGQLLDVVELLEQRGTPRFATLSKKLYGSSRDPRTPGAAEPDGNGRQPWLSPTALLEDLEGEERTLDASAAARLLSERLSRYFLDAPPVRVQLSSSLAADASAGGDHLKVRQDARFSLREVRTSGSPRRLGFTFGYDAQRTAPADLYVLEQVAAGGHGHPGRAGGADGSAGLRLAPGPIAPAGQPSRSGGPGRGRRRLPRRVPILPATRLRCARELPAHGANLPR